MKRISTASLSVMFLLCASGVAGAGTVTWDNFPVTGDFPNGYDTDSRFTSERDTQHSMGLMSASWAVDDFHVPVDVEVGPNEEVVVTEIEWVGVRQLFDRPGFGYDRLDFVILTRTVDGGTGEFDFTPLEYGGGQTALFLNQQIGVDWEITEELGPVTSNEFAYRGRVQVPNVPLALETDYWVGVRLVGNDANDEGGTAGRHFIVAGSGHPDSVDTAFRHDPPRGGADWQYIENPLTGERFDAAYRLGMSVIPEPATAAMLGLVGMFALRRRGT